MKFILLFILFFSSAIANKETIFTHQAKPSQNDKQYDYDISLLKLVLEKTTATFGSYKLKAAPKMNAARTLKVLEYNTIENFIVKRSYSNKLLKKLNYVSFPVNKVL